MLWSFVETLRLSPVLTSTVDIRVYSIPSTRPRRCLRVRQRSYLVAPTVELDNTTWLVLLNNSTAIDYWLTHPPRRPRSCHHDEYGTNLRCSPGRYARSSWSRSRWPPYGVWSSLESRRTWWRTTTTTRGLYGADASGVVRPWSSTSQPGRTYDGWYASRSRWCARSI